MQSGLWKETYEKRHLIRDPCNETYEKRPMKTDLWKETYATRPMKRGVWKIIIGSSVMCVSNTHIRKSVDLVHRYWHLISSPGTVQHALCVDLTHVSVCSPIDLVEWYRLFIHHDYMYRCFDIDDICRCIDIMIIYIDLLIYTLI